MVANDLVSWIFFTAGNEKQISCWFDWLGCFFFIILLSLQHHMEMQMTWKLSIPSLSSFASCEVVCVLQSAPKTDLFHSLNYSDRWQFLERSGLFCFFLSSCPCCSLGEERIQCWLPAEPCLYLSAVFWLVWAVCAWRGTVTLLSHCHVQLDLCWRITQKSKFAGIFVVQNLQHSLPLDPLASHLFLFSHIAVLMFLYFLNMTFKPDNTCEFSMEGFCSTQDTDWALSSPPCTAQPLWTCNSAVSWTSPSRAVVFHLCN